MSRFALGLDPGFKNLGTAVLEIATNVVVQMGFIETTKLRKIDVIDDNVRRAEELYDGLVLLCQQYPGISVICAEGLSLPRSASVISQQSILWGVVIAFARSRSLPLVYTDPKSLKRDVAGSRSAEKSEVISALSRLFSSQDLRSLHSSVSPGDWNHLYDALGAIVACQNRAEYTMLKPRGAIKT